MIWIDLLVAGVSSQVPATVGTGMDADIERLDVGEPLEISEVLSGVAASLEDWMPETDKALLGVVARDGSVARDLRERGLLVVREDGGLGFTLGRGLVAESVGESLAAVLVPESGRYVRGYRFPGYQYWGK